jgi:cytochrome b561
MSHSFIAWGYRCWTSALPTFLWIGFFLFSLVMIRFAITATTARQRYAPKPNAWRRLT